MFKKASSIRHDPEGREKARCPVDRYALSHAHHHTYSLCHSSRTITLPPVHPPNVSVPCRTFTPCDRGSADRMPLDCPIPASHPLTTRTRLAILRCSHRPRRQYRHCFQAVGLFFQSKLRAPSATPLFDTIMEELSALMAPGERAEIGVLHM